MDRGATAAVIAELLADKCQPCHLIQIQYDAETIYLTDAYKTISWGGNDYIALGHFIEFSDIEESARFQVSSISASLTISDESKVRLSEFLTYSYIDRLVLIYKAFLSTTDDSLVANPFLIFKGRIDSPVLKENPEKGESILSVTISNHFSDFEKVTGRFTNHECQQIWFPGDNGFEYASEIIRELKWGRA